MKRNRFSYIVGLVAVCLSSSAALAADAADAQEEQYRERQVLDPETGEWVNQTEPLVGAPSDELDQARVLLAEGKPRKARKLLEEWLEANYDDPRYEEAELLLGETYFETGDYWKAVERFQSVAENSTGELFHKANGRCVDVARAFLSGQKRIVWRILRLQAYDEGVELLDRVWQREPGTRLGEVSLKLKADHFFERGEVELAQDEYANLVMQFPSGRYTQLAMLRTAESAEAAFPGIQFDDRALLEADERYRQLRAAFPTYAEHEKVDDRLAGIRETRAEKDLDIAKWYERTRRPDAAIFYYREIIDDYPETLAAAESMARLRNLGVSETADDEIEEPEEADEELEPEPLEEESQS